VSIVAYVCPHCGAREKREFAPVVECFACHREVRLTPHVAPKPHTSSCSHWLGEGCNCEVGKAYEGEME